MKVGEILAGLRTQDFTVLPALWPSSWSSSIKWFDGLHPYPEKGSRARESKASVWKEHKMDVALLKGKLEMCLKICQMYMAFYPAISLQGIHTK